MQGCILINAHYIISDRNSINNQALLNGALSIFLACILVCKFIALIYQSVSLFIKILVINMLDHIVLKEL